MQFLDHSQSNEGFQVAWPSWNVTLFMWIQIVWNFMCIFFFRKLFLFNFIKMLFEKSLSYIINTLEEFSRSYTGKGFNNWHEIIILMDIVMIDNAIKQIVLPHPRKIKDWQSTAATFLFLFSSSFVMYFLHLKPK